MQCQILLVIHNWIQGNLEGESGNLSEVTKGFSPGTPAIIIIDELGRFLQCSTSWTIRRTGSTSNAGVRVQIPFQAWIFQAFLAAANKQC